MTKILKGISLFVGILGFISMLAYSGGQLMGWVLLGDYTDINIKSVPTRVALTIGFLCWSLVFFIVMLTPFRVVVGVLEIAIAMGSNWHQLAQMASGNDTLTLSTRLAFIAAGTAVIVKGADDVKTGFQTWEEVEKNRKEKQKARRNIMIRANESSGAPTPARPNLEAK